MPHVLMLIAATCHRRASDTTMLINSGCFTIKKKISGMVRTRASGDVDVSDCASRRLARRHSCHIRNRAGKLVRVPYINCTRGCRPRRCKNYAVCGVEFLESPNAGSEDNNFLCQRCICFLAGQNIEKVSEPATTETCPICYEENLTMYRMPQCQHSFCGACLGRVLFRNMPKSGASDKRCFAAGLDPILFTGNQSCPLCRRTDARGMLLRHQIICNSRPPGSDEAWATFIRQIMTECAQRVHAPVMAPPPLSRTRTL